ncbi:MFS general substrate transporter [Coniochaeta ligniaria NRRL 30616]|uniref:MFS general substrate transporter n=1 Tax=Coniochaeta ligniaria NRRL 30616 TaxID=1408157 RepID=A0A1J7IFE7_9PEZI|nr:MFS general substrate transporter [Coniochaeta ligniaria NRRL 30616]
MTPEEAALNRRVSRKMDICMLPLLSLLYLFNGLDKSNIGNAQTQGFMQAIGAQPTDLNYATSLFFITFVIFQPISAGVGRWIGPKNWIPIMMLSWGAVTVGQAFIHGKGTFIAMRLLIGLFEAGFYPTACGYLSCFYPRFDLAIRVGVFYGQYAIAGAFSGALSYGIFQIHHGSLLNWQYLFVIEGALTCILAVIAWFALPAGPGSAWFLTAEERAFAVERIRADSALFVQHEYGEDGVETDRLTRRDVIETAKDWKLWFALVFNICASVPTQAFSVFLPLVLAALGYSKLQANLMTVPPYVCGAVGLWIFAWNSDRVQERGYHIVASIGIGLIGLIVTVTAQTQGGKYAGLCVLLFGCYVSAPLTIAWLAGNTPEPGKRSLVLGVNGFGNLAGVIGSQVYSAKYAPSYHVSFYVTLGFVAASFVGYLALRFTFAAVNRHKRALLAQMTQEEIEEERRSTARYGDKKHTFIYGL